MRWTFGSDFPPGVYSDSIQMRTSTLACSTPVVKAPMVMMLALLLLRARSAE